MGSVFSEVFRLVTFNPGRILPLLTVVKMVSIGLQDIEDFTSSFKVETVTECYPRIGKELAFFYTLR